LRGVAARQAIVAMARIVRRGALDERRIAFPGTALIRRRMLLNG
jgi:acyl CoA:acetate/3-ketoacid CoA transferase alpha subunit